MFTSVSTRAASAYRRVAVETDVQASDRHHLISLLFDGLLQSLSKAQIALERGELSTKGEQIGKALRILDEGLLAGVDEARGGELAVNLRMLYTYCAHRLTLANLNNDSKLLAEVVALIEPVSASWQQIREEALAGA
ncbi:MAG: flagellar export chaperone FliS [Hydrogenophaga sp.]|uniref:flagellar export chaperone FliS n=1 Tax=Hydrogenophaga sp. TaxID=1904254 RepID=UPI001DCAD1CA|nr:flagellar export chaperone FliS [Hydrogenophaga sp.]MBX3609686.1 flagellar export chaperone FliS [Hydrogenophaga sp.]